MCLDGTDLIYWIPGALHDVGCLPQPAAHLALATTFGTAQKKRVITYPFIGITATTYHDSENHLNGLILFLQIFGFLLDLNLEI